MPIILDWYEVNTPLILGSKSRKHTNRKSISPPHALFLQRNHQNFLAFTIWVKKEKSQKI